MNDISRRSIAKGAAWAIPAVTVAAAAPAMAASCQPKTVDAEARVTSAISGIGSKSSVVTFTNNGPNDLPAGTKITISTSVTYNDSNESSTQDPNITALSQSDVVDIDLGDFGGPLDEQQNPENEPDVWSHSWFWNTIVLTTKKDIASGDSFGYSQTFDDPAGRTLQGTSLEVKRSGPTSVTTYDEATCTTTITQVTVDGGSGAGAGG